MSLVLIVSKKKQCRKCLHCIKNRQHDRAKTGSPCAPFSLVVPRASAGGGVAQSDVAP